MARTELEQVDGARAGAWIALALRDGFGGYVKQQVPQVYEAYARVLHPPGDEDGNVVTWSEVTRRLRTVAHREMQWHAIVGSYDTFNFTDSRWPGDDPWTGELPEDKVDALCVVLAGHTRTPSAYFGISTITSGVAEEWPDAPRLEGLRRDWVVLKGPLAAIDQIALSNRHGFGFEVLLYADGRRETRRNDERPERFSRAAPSLIWPDDRAWFVASDVDLDSTLVGGSRALIDELLAAPELDVWEVDGEVSLQADADKLNPVPEPPPGWGEPGDPEVMTRGAFDEHLGMVAGTIAMARVDDGVLTVEIVPDAGPGWKLSAGHSTWSAAEVDLLPGATIEQLGLDAEGDALRLRLVGGRVFEIVPLPRESDADPPSWRVESPMGVKLKHGPGLLFEFPDG